jgi:LysM repeat protein
MGLIPFIMKCGTDLLKGGDEAEEVQEMLKEEFGGRISDLKVEFDGGVVTLAGNCDSQATREKAILLAGNINGVEKVNDENFSSPPDEVSTEFYVIQKGDSLSKIAEHYYGDPKKYPIIFEANREVIKDADLIYPGQTVRIPTSSGETRNIIKMQGRWQSKDDASYVIEIKGDQFIHWHNNEKEGTGTITFVNNCEEHADDPESKYFMVVEESDADPNCYYLIRAEEAVLEFSSLPRGNTLSFTKVE